MSFLLWAVLVTVPPKQKAATSTHRKVDVEAVFKKHCMVCHGSDGKGNAAYEPPDFTDRKFQKSIRDADIREAIRNGSAAMPPFQDKLSEAEVKALVGKVRAFGKERKRERNLRRHRERENNRTYDKPLLQNFLLGLE